MCPRSLARLPGVAPLRSQMSEQPTDKESWFQPKRTGFAPGADPDGCESRLQPKSLRLVQISSPAACTLVSSILPGRGGQSRIRREWREPNLSEPL